MSRKYSNEAKQKFINFCIKRAKALKEKRMNEFIAYSIEIHATRGNVPKNMRANKFIESFQENII